LTILNKLNLNRQYLNTETLWLYRISCTIQLNPHLKSTLRLRTSTNNINNSDLVKAELKSPSKSELVKAYILDMLPSLQ
jgi:hypothetical protein